MSKRWFPGVLLAAALAACGGGDGGGDGGDDDAPPVPDAGGGDQPDAFVPPQGSFTVTWGPVMVDPGVENTQCVYVKLGNPSQIHVNQIHNVLSGGSHHFIVYRQNTGSEQPTPMDCQPFAGTLKPQDGAPIMITQIPDETLTLPAGVGFTMAPDQLIRLEMHFINTGDQPVEVKGTSTFIPMADGEFQHEADFLFAGDIKIMLPQGVSLVGPSFIDMPAEFNNVNFFGITGHAHQWGTNVRVWAAANGGDASMPVYDVVGWKWDEPETVYHDPAFQLPGGGGFRIQCDYNNMSGGTVNFGESANQEMCFFWGYYYPSQGARVCATYGGGLSDCCPGGSPVLCNLL
jgi:hypothetical protein